MLGGRGPYEGKVRYLYYYYSRLGVIEEGLLVLPLRHQKILDYVSDMDMYDSLTGNKKRT